MSLYLNPRFFYYILRKLVDTLNNLPPLLTGLSIHANDFHTVFGDQHTQVNADPTDEDNVITTLPLLTYTFIPPTNIVLGTNGFMTDLTVSGDITTINYVFEGVKPGLYDLVFYAGSTASGNVVVDVDDVTSAREILLDYTDNLIGADLVDVTFPLVDNYTDGVLKPNESKKSLITDLSSIIHVFDEIKTVRVRFLPSSNINFILADRVYLIEKFPDDILLPLQNRPL